VGIKIKGSFVNAVKNVINQAKRKFNDSDTWEPLVDDIREQITKGISPVAGGGRFKKYSDSYRKAIKARTEQTAFKGGKVSPVDMTLSGEMMESLTAKKKTNTVVIEFEDKKAVYHNNQGAGKSKVIRRLLPDQNGEKFNRKLLQTMRETVAEILRKIR
jgi:uncharacterized protein (DUF1330 family)